VPAAELAGMMSGALLRRGVPEDHAAWVVDGLVEASLRGIDTHGVRLFPVYLAELDGGRSRARPELRWQGDGAAPAALRLLDAGHALGMVAGRVATDEAIRLARSAGIGAVAVRNSNHFGAASCYTLEIARHDMIGLACSNSDALVAPFGGLAPFFGTNPLSLAAPAAGGDGFCADFATSQVSYSRLLRQRELAAPIPAGWAVTGGGEDAASAGAEEVVALLPLGGHKGQCLAMAVEILCCLLAGAPFDHQLSHLYAPPFDAPRQIAHFIVALDVSRCGAPTAFRARLSELHTAVRAQPAAAPAGEVLVPGDPERAAAAERVEGGIPMTDEDWQRFTAAAAP
jgi:ureidoglycolate dehydrogenase (NAD+)